MRVSACTKKTYGKRIALTRKLGLEENIGAAAVELTPDDLREIDSAALNINVQGARYPERLAQMTGR